MTRELRELAFKYVSIVQPYSDEFNGGWTPPDDATRQASAHAFREFHDKAKDTNWIKLLDEAREIHRLIHNK